MGEKMRRIASQRVVRVGKVVDGKGLGWRDWRRYSMYLALSDLDMVTIKKEERKGILLV